MTQTVPDISPLMPMHQDPLLVNTLRLGQHGRHFADNIFNCIFLNENVWIPIKISLKFVPKGPINNIPVLVQIMAWRRPGDKPLSEPMMVRLPTHICVTRPQWVNTFYLAWWKTHHIGNNLQTAQDRLENVHSLFLQNGPMGAWSILLH